MRYELGDYEWTVIKPMLRNKQRGVRRVTVACSMASFGSCVLERHGATCPRAMVPASPFTTASFVGAGQAAVGAIAGQKFRQLNRL
jgi:transposase